MQTRQDLHRRHAREREALESQTAALQQRIQSLQAAEKKQSAADSALQVPLAALSMFPALLVYFFLKHATELFTAGGPEAEIRQQVSA